MILFIPGSLDPGSWGNLWGALGFDLCFHRATISRKCFSGGTLLGAGMAEKRIEGNNKAINKAVAEKVGKLSTRLSPVFLLTC